MGDFAFKVTGRGLGSAKGPITTAHGHFNSKHNTNISKAAFEAHLYGGDAPDHSKIMEHLPDDYEATPAQLKEHFGLTKGHIRTIMRRGENG